MKMAFHKAIVITTLGKRSNTIQMAEITEDSLFSDGGGPRKRKRLTHLSADEKMMRRKLKNRVAAQTARDRKKALMQDLEDKVSLLQEENKQLLKENAELRRNQSTMQKENEYLKRLTVPSSVTEAAVVAPEAVPCKVEVPDFVALPCKTDPDSPGSAAPAVSLPKEQVQVLSRVMMRYAVCALTLRVEFLSAQTELQPLTSDALLHFLEEFCAQDGEFSLKQEAQAEESSTASLSQHRVYTVCGKVSEGASMVGSPAANVDSINELIQADHLYYKEEPSAPVISCVASSTVSSDLLSSDPVTSTVVTGSVEDLKVEPIFSSPAIVSDQGQQQTVQTSTASTKQSVPRTGTLGVNSKAALTTMVNPNLIYSPRPRTTEQASLESNFLDMDVGLLTDELGLDCLLDFDDLQDIASGDHASQPQQQQNHETVITISASAPAPALKSKSNQQKLSVSTPRTSASSTVDPISPQVVFGLDLDSTAEQGQFQSGSQSPDSGFTSDGGDNCSHASDSAPSPDNSNSSEVDTFDWDEDLYVPLDLFPDVNLC